MAEKYSGATAYAALMVKDRIRQFGIYVNDAGVELSNIILYAAEEQAKKDAPVRKKPYPPAIDRTPGTLKRSIYVIPATAEKPGKIVCDTWLWEWIEGWNARSAALKARTGRGLKAHRRVSKTERKRNKSARFKSMIKSDPRRVLGQPMEDQVGFVKSEKRMVRKIEKCAEKAAREGVIHLFDADAAYAAEMRARGVRGY